MIGCGCQNYLDHTQKRDTAKHWFNGLKQEFRNHIVEVLTEGSPESLEDTEWMTNEQFIRTFVHNDYRDDWLEYIGEPEVKYHYKVIGPTWTRVYDNEELANWFVDRWHIFNPDLTAVVEPIIIPFDPTNPHNHSSTECDMCGTCSICGHCGNNSCNGGYGQELDRSPCKVCPTLDEWEPHKKIYGNYDGT